jgi:hypothetical protein
MNTTQSISGAASMAGDRISISNLGSGLSSGETFTILQASSTGTDYADVIPTASGCARR